MRNHAGVIASLAGPPLTGLAWRLKANSGVFQDQAGTIPATAYNDPIMRWNDSMGGSLYADQSSSLHAPQYDPNRGTVNSTQNITNNAYQMLNLHNFNFNTVNGSLFMISHQMSLRTGINMLLGLDGVSLWGFSGNAVSFGEQAYKHHFQVGGPFDNSTPRLPTGTSLLGVVGSGSALQLVTNDTTDSFASWSATASGGSILAFAGGSYFSVCSGIKEILCYNRPLTSDEITQMRSYAATVGATITANNCIVFDGDSITTGFAATVYRGYVQRTEEQLGTRFKSYNVSLGGYALSSMLTDAPTVVDPLIQAGHRNICMIFAGTNDIALNSSTGAQTASRLASYYAARKSAGWDQVITATMLPRNGTEGNNFNALLRGSPSTYCDVLLDWGDDAAITFAGSVHPGRCRSCSYGDKLSGAGTSGPAGVDHFR